MKLAEQNVISGLLTLNDVDYAYETLDADMFTDAILGKMFYILKEAYKKKTPTDITYLTQRLTDFPESLVNDAVMDIASLSPIGLEFKVCVKTILDEHNATIANKLISQTDINGGNVYDKVDEIVAALGKITKNESNGKTLAEMVKDNQDNCFIPKENGIKIGFTELDADLGGLEPGDLIIIAARPAVGKTAFALQVVDHVAKSGKKIILFNLEMTEKQIYQRMIARESGITLSRIRTATKFMNDEEEIRFTAANENLSKRTNLIVETGGQTVSNIRQIAKNQKASVIVVDYLQLIKAESYYKGNRYAEVGQISHDLKAIARDLNIPVIVLSQINRNSEGKDSKEPTMSELRESGDIEQDASVILMLWNLDKDDYTKKGIKIEKNRQGTLGKHKLHFEGSEMKFTEAWEEPQDEELPFEPEKG